MSKRALLIGVNNYPLLGPLRYAEADAKGVAESLRRNYGFAESEIILMTSNSPRKLRPSKKSVKSQLQRIKKKARNLDFLLVGFWGHGRLSLDQTSRYLCLPGSSIENLQDTALTFDLLNGYLKEIGALNTCLILDCCQTIANFARGDNQVMTEEESKSLSEFGDQTARDIRAKRDSLGMPYTPPTVAILNACMAGQQAYEWDQRHHGLFTAHLLDGMEQQLDSVGSWSRYVAEHVPETALAQGQYQTPFFKLSGAGDIALNPNVENTKPDNKEDNPDLPPTVDDKKAGQGKILTIKEITAVAIVLAILFALIFMSNKSVPPSSQPEDYVPEQGYVTEVPTPSKTGTTSPKQGHVTEVPPPPSKTGTTSPKQGYVTEVPPPPSKTGTTSPKQGHVTEVPPPPSKNGYNVP